MERGIRWIARQFEFAAREVVKGDIIGSGRGGIMIVQVAK
jgi:hypothetical protein